MPSLLLPLSVAAAIGTVMLAGCPEERRASEREMPAQRISPAPTAQPEATSKGAPAPSDGGVTRRP